MNKIIFRFAILLFSSIMLLTACGDDDNEMMTTDNDMVDDMDDDSDDDNSDNDDNDNDDGTIVNSDYFLTTSFVSMEMVTCTLEDGSTTECFEIVFTGDGVDGEAGPYCPTTIDDIGGLSLYDGETNPGLRNIAKDYLMDLVADGFTVFDEDDQDKVNVRLTSEKFAPDGFSYCLQLPFDGDLTFTYTIPVTPVSADEDVVLDEFDRIGFTVEGASIIAEVPSATLGPDGMTSDEINYPSLDPCGGHPDNSGDYHLHFIPQLMNQVLDANNISTVSCTLFDQVSSGSVLVGYALDGYPIYAYAEIPNDLDQCNGRTAATDEYPDGIYHYVGTTDSPNVPPCRKGLAAEMPVSIK